MFKEEFYMHIPQNWFMSDKGHPVKWSSEIEVTATIDFKYIGVLNASNRLYLGFYGANLIKYKSLKEKQEKAVHNYAID